MKALAKLMASLVFVKDAVIGDTIMAKIMKAKKELRLWTVDGDPETIAIPRRTGVVCLARQCGGCQPSAVSYEEQKVFKEKKLRGSSGTYWWVHKSSDGTID